MPAKKKADKRGQPKTIHIPKECMATFQSLAEQNRMKVKNYIEKILIDIAKDNEMRNSRLYIYKNQ